jgi:hypothetical protein
MPVRVCPVDIAVPSDVSESDDGGGGGTKSLLLGSLTFLSSVVVRGRGEVSVRVRKSFGRDTSGPGTLFHPQITQITQI